jgi:hypothetical protein
MTRRARALTAVLGLAAVLAAPPAAPAQPAARSEFLEGTHAFRRILYDVGRRDRLKPLSDVDGQTDPRRTLIVVLGAPKPLAALDERLPGGLTGFVERGGALLVVTDQQTPRVLADRFGVGVSGVQLTMRGPGSYRDMPECPYVDPQPGADPPIFEPGLAGARNQPARRIATNLPSYLEAGPLRGIPPRRGVSLLAHVRGQRADGVWGFINWGFAAGGPVSDGRVLILADHSIFINEMMLQADNGNIDFAYRCAQWLMVRPEDNVVRHSTRALGNLRDQILYYDDGTVRGSRADFAIPLKDLPPPPIPPPDTIMGMLDEALPAMEEEGIFARMEEENIVNDYVTDTMASLSLWKGARPEWKIWTLALIAVSASLGVYALVRLGAFRHRPETAAPLLTALLEKQAPAGAVLAQRQEALLRDGNLWEAARELARHLFLSAGASPDAGPAPPALEVRGGWWGRWQARRRWRELWRLARSARPVRVSPRGFARLAARVRALQAALADGTARINK